MQNQYRPLELDDFKPRDSLKNCDLVMKGGVTSGIVYSTAIPKLATEYRLKNIGGTSAGAIGAIIAAAAEYRRQKNGSAEGFIATQALSEELADNLSKIFQPTSGLKSLFSALFGGLGKGMFGKIWSFMTAYWFLTLPLLFACSFGVFKVLKPHFLTDMMLCNAIIYAAFFIPTFIILWAVTILTWIFFINFRTLRKNNYGMCSGKTQTRQGPLAFSDWIAEKINFVAGIPFGDEHDPLCVKDLKDYDIYPTTITTDLSTGRPYQLPLLTSAHYFQEDEFRQLFPDWIMDYLIKKGEAYGREPIHIKKGLYKLAHGDDMPILLLVRLSLSFPILISAVPLYRCDYTEDGTEKNEYEKCLFSDGGISSNFPIHFFDSILPSRPTFGITLNSIKGLSKTVSHNNRVRFLTAAVSESTPVNPVTGLLSFFGKMFGAAANWQDTLQTQLNGYAERIVEIKLDANKEGGLNLNMEDDIVRDLQKFGQDAGRALLEDFKEDKHRYYRAVAAMPHLEALLLNYAKSYNNPSEWTGEDWPYIFEDMPETYRSKKRKPIHKLAQEIAALGETRRISKDSYVGKIRKNYGAQIDANIRLVADANRTPKHAEKP